MVWPLWHVSSPCGLHLCIRAGEDGCLERGSLLSLRASKPLSLPGPCLLSPLKASMNPCYQCPFSGEESLPLHGWQQMTVLVCAAGRTDEPGSRVGMSLCCFMEGAPLRLQKHGLGNSSSDCEGHERCSLKTTWSNGCPLVHRAKHITFSPTAGWKSAPFLKEHNKYALMVLKSIGFPNIS